MTRSLADRMRMAVAAQSALDAHSRREKAAGIYEETPEFLRLNRAVCDALDHIPFGLRSLAALDLFAAADAWLARRPAADH